MGLNIIDYLGIKTSLYLNTTAKQSINAGIKRNVDTFKSIGKVVDDTYNDMTIGAIKQANKVVPNSINNYLRKPSNITNNLNDFTSSALPGIPVNNRAGHYGYVGAAIYNHESTIGDIEKGIDLLRDIFEKENNNGK